MADFSLAPDPAHHMEMDELTGQLRDIGVRRGGVLLVHASYRAVRPVAGGPAAVISALQSVLGDEGTLVMPAWGDDHDAPFDAVATRVADDLGVIAQTFARMPGVRRSDHPFAFAARGPYAAFIVDDPLPLPPHRLESPVGRVYERDGQVLLLGVGHDNDTTVHLAEALAQVPYGVKKHCTIAVNGRPTRVEYAENDHCCRGFARMDEWLRARDRQREGTVGAAFARLAQSRDIVSIAREQLTTDPLVFLCAPSAACSECDAARKSAR